MTVDSKPSKRTVKPLWVVAGVLVLAGLAGFLYSRASLFRTSSVELRADAETVEQDLKASLVDVLGRSLFSISAQSVEETLRRHPRVESVDIRRQWPSKLSVFVRTRQSVAMQFVDRELWTVDSRGKAIEPMRDPENLILLKRFPSLDRLTAVERGWFEEFFSLLSSGADHSEELSLLPFEEVRWDWSQGFVLRSSELDLDVELGHANVSRAFLNASRAYGLLKDRGVRPQFLDASYRSRVVVRLAPKLQNSNDPLNLEELERREENLNPSAR